VGIQVTASRALVFKYFSSDRAEESQGGHAEIRFGEMHHHSASTAPCQSQAVDRFDNVCVPLDNILLGEGRGFEIAQGRLGPGRVHHCMRLIGLGNRALNLMVLRASERSAFGKQLSKNECVLRDIAESRLKVRLLVVNIRHSVMMGVFHIFAFQLEEMRQLTLHTAWTMDQLGNKVCF
jgi:alkylation response protein AidB-like acyl-CoA dehydrogenase